MSKISQSDKHKTKLISTKRKVRNEKEEGEESSDDEPQASRNKPNPKIAEKEEGEDSGSKSSDVDAKKSKATSKKSTNKKNASNSSSSSSSDSSDEDGDDDDDEMAKNDIDEIKVNKTKNRLASLKQKYDEARHKLEKIERALIKAENENNKENVSKCKKYKKLYDQKVKDLKITLKQTKSKLDKYVEIVNAKNSANSNNKKAEEVFKKPSQMTADLSQAKANEKQQILAKDVQQKETKPTQQQPQPQTVLKLPFPVLNDKRDFQTILKTLETKYSELQNKKEANRKSIDSFSSFTSNKKLMEKNEQMVDKLKQLDKSISLLIQRLVKQMDYLKLSLNLESIKKRNLMSDSETISRMSHTLGEMFNYMKNENKEYIMKQKKLSDPNEIEVNQQPEEPSPMIKLNELYDQVNKSLTAVLAHTAACAHSSAAINAYNYSIYYQQQLKLQESQVSVNVTKEALDEIKSPVVPLVTELKNASSKFSLFKEKISSFFRTTKQVTTEKTSTPSNSTKKDGLNKLIADYDDDEENDGHENADESDLKIKQPNFNETKQLVSKKASNVNLEDDEESYTEDEDDLVGDSIIFNDLGNNCDLEIITTSELKQSDYYKKRNYLLPSLKAINFPLKASLSFNDPIRFVKKEPDTLIAVERSKCGLTFLGNSNKSTNSFGQKQNKLYEILYLHQQK